MESENATGADLVADDVTVECPELQRGKRLVVVVRPVDAAAIAAALGGIPPLVDPAAKQEKGSLAEEFALMREVGRLGIVSPEMTFGEKPEPGRAWWGMVRPANRTAIVIAIMQASGLLADGGPLGRFHSEPEGDGPSADAARVGETAAEPLAPAAAT